MNHRWEDLGQLLDVTLTRLWDPAPITAVSVAEFAHAVELAGETVGASETQKLAAVEAVVAHARPTDAVDDFGDEALQAAIWLLRESRLRLVLVTVGTPEGDASVVLHEMGLVQIEDLVKRPVGRRRLLVRRAA